MYVPVTTSKAAQMAKRQKDVAALYLNRFGDMQDIADKLGVSKATVSRDVKTLKKKWATEAQGDISEVIAREIAELDRMELEASVMYQQFKGNKEKNIPTNSREANKWLETRLKIKDRRAKLLGLDRPSKVELDANMTHDIKKPPSEMTDEELDQEINDDLKKLIEAGLIPDPSKV